MVAVAASPTPGAAASSPFSSRSHNHPPYKDMILSAIEALKDSKGSSRHAISKYISENYSDLPASHSSLLNLHLRRLHSNGLIQMLKHSYKLSDTASTENRSADVVSRKRGRPPKNAQPSSSILNETPKRRGRPPKLASDTIQATKKSTDQMLNPETLTVDTAAVYILPQAEQLKSGFLQSLPGAVAIVLPEGLLSKETAKSPVLILPNGVQSLVDSASRKKKLGSPRLFEHQPNEVEVIQPSSPGEEVLPEQVEELPIIAPRRPGRPRKFKNSVLPENLPSESFNPETEQEYLPESHEGPRSLENFIIPEIKKRSVGRPRKYPAVEGSKSYLSAAIAN